MSLNRNQIHQYDIDEHLVLSMWDCKDVYIVRLDNTNPDLTHAFILLNTEDESQAERFYEVVKSAYEELVF